MIGRAVLRRLMVLTAGVVTLAPVVPAASAILSPAFAQTVSGADQVAGLPGRIRTKVPAILEERLADIERVASTLPGMDRKKAYLITLPLQNYLEDVVLSGSREVVLYPRAIAWVIGQEAGRGISKKEIARLLVTHYQRDEYARMVVNHPSLGVSDPVGGKQE